MFTPYRPLTMIRLLQQTEVQQQRQWSSRKGAPQNVQWNRLSVPAGPTTTSMSAYNSDSICISCLYPVELPIGALYLLQGSLHKRNDLRNSQVHIITSRPLLDWWRKIQYLKEAQYSSIQYITIKSYVYPVC